MRRCPYPVAIAALVAYAQLAGGAVPGAAEGLSLLAELEYADTSFSTEDADTREVTDIDSTRITQIYHLDISQHIYPNLLLEVGGLMDADTTETDTAANTTKSRARTIRPFVDLRLATPTVQAATVYRRTEVKNTATGAPVVRNFVDEYTGELSFRPRDLPQVAMNYTRLQARDEPETSDSVKDLFTLRGRYEWREFAVNYDHSQTKLEERIADSSSETQADSARVTYGHRFLDSRLVLNLGSRIDRAVVTTGGSGATHVATASPGSAFFFSGTAAAISDPLGLIPDDFQPFVSGSNVVNIGRSGGIVPVGIGLDFGFPTEVDTLYVPIRPAETAPNLAGQVSAIVGSFTWRLFVSDDQETWREANIAAVAFTAVFGRFEVTFAQSQDVRFFHLVVTPTVIPTAPQTIYIAGIEGLVTVPGGSGVELKSLNQDYNLRLQYRVSDKTMVGYDLGYHEQDSNSGDHRRATLNNGVNGQHRFNDVFTGNARFIRSDTWETDRADESSNSFTAALRGAYLPTLSQTLTYNATYSTDQDGSSHTHALGLRNNAELYEGWSMSLDLGGSRGESVQGEAFSSAFVRVVNHLVPNVKANVDLSYSAIRSSRADQDAALRQQADLQVFVVPFATLSLLARISVDDDQSREAPANVRQNYSVGWRPFPDGTFQCSVSYREILASDGDELKSISPMVQWQVFRGGQVAVEYSTGTVKTVNEARDFATLTANLRLIY